MVNTTIHTPFQLLQEIERRAKLRAKGLPRQENVQEIWRGIAFRLGEALLVSPINDIREVILCPTVLARVPGAKGWVKGLANVRGILLPVVDLKACLDNRPLTMESKTRLIIINQAGIYAGLLVDEVMGIKHFPEQARDTETPCKEPWVAPFAKGLFSYDNMTWTVFDMHTLAESEIFLKAAV